MSLCPYFNIEQLKLLTNTVVCRQLYLQSPAQDPIFLNSFTNSVFLHSHKASQLQLWVPFCVLWVSEHESFHYNYLPFLSVSQFPSMFVLFVANSAVMSLFQGHVIVKVIPQQDLSKLVAVLDSINRLWIHSH